MPRTAGDGIGLSLGDRRPLGFETSAVIERLLRFYTGGRKAGVEIGGHHGFAFLESFCPYTTEPPTERIARARAVNALHEIGRNVLHAVSPREQRAIRSQSDQHAPNTAGQQFLRAALRIVHVAYRQTGN